MNSGPATRAASSFANTAKKIIPSKANTGFFILLLVAILVIALVLWLLVKAYNTNNIRATPDNIKTIQLQQTNALETRWIGVSQKLQGLDTSISTIPDDQQMLMNVNVRSARLTGYLGPYNSGVFSEDTATRLALGSGARCLILEIGREVNSYEPKLIYRDGWGIKQSLNMGSIQKVAKSIAGRAFTASSEGAPSDVASNPLFVVIYFVSTPDPVRTPKEYVQFMGKVAQQLQPLSNLIVGQTPQGDFRRQAQESQLFFYNYKLFTNKIIILTNADTTPFRKLDGLGLASEIKPNQDLDLLVHARLYSRESPSGLGISSGPTSSVKPAAIITTPNYWLSTPPDRLAAAQAETKSAWTIVMSPVSSATNALLKDDLTKLITNYGVQSIPFCIFDVPTVTDNFTGNGALFEKSSWAVKPELLRFIPPKPIVVKKPIPETNSGGGAVITPTF
jgi:hypothetical protein